MRSDITNKHPLIKDAIESGSTETVKMMIEIDPKFILLTHFGSIFHWTAANGNIEIFEYLIKIGVPKLFDVLNIKYNSSDSIQQLIFNSKDRAGDMPFNHAAYNGRLEFIRYYAQSNPEIIYLRGSFDNTLLHSTAKGKNNYQMIKYLINIAPDLTTNSYLAKNNMGENSSYYAKKEYTEAINYYFMVLENVLMWKMKQRALA